MPIDLLRGIAKLLTALVGLTVKLALAECERLGREEFLRRYGYGHAREYVLRYGGHEYDSKAIAAGGCTVFLLLLWRAVTARAVVRTTHKAKRRTSQRVTMLLWSFRLFLSPSLFLLPARPLEWGVRFPFSEKMFFMGQWRFPVQSLKKR